MGYIIEVSFTEFFCDVVKVVIIQKIILAEFGYILDMKGGKQTGVFDSNSSPHTLLLDEV
jgi:hypothetical protein